MRPIITISMVLFYFYTSLLFADEKHRWRIISKHDNPYQFNAVRYSLGVSNAEKKRAYAYMQGEHQWRNFYIMDYFMPFAGIAMDKTQNLYFYSGIRTQAKYNKHFLVGASFAPTLYKHGDEKNLGSVLQFRTGLEFAYEFGNQSQLGLELAHYSNAGLSKNNPGLEALTLTYTVPY